MFGTSTPRVPLGSSPRFECGDLSFKGSEDDSGVDLSSTSTSTSTSTSVSSSFNSFDKDRFPRGRVNYAWWIGRERLDMLRLLQDMNARHLIALIGSYLGGKDLINMCLVSKTWNDIVNSHYQSLKLSYLLSIKSDSENSGYEEMRRTRTTPRKAMSNVSNLVTNSSFLSTSFSSSSFTSIRTSPTSPSKIRHRLFTEEASKLSPGECLQSCPRCTNPSRVIPSEFRAKCSRISCGFDFCTKCMCSAHVGAEGASLCRTPTKSSSGRISNKSIVSNKKSRRRLRRL